MFSQKNNLLSSSLLGYDSNTLPTDWEYDTNGLRVRYQRTGSPSLIGLE